MLAQVKAWENSQGIRLSKDILDDAGIRENDFLNISVVDGNIVLSKIFRHKTLEERAVALDGKVGPYEEFQWGEPVGRETW